MYLKLFFLILLSFLCHVKTDSENEELSITTTEIEPNNDKYNVSEVGAREYLQPNLVALHNMAIMYLPKTFNFLNIIEAYRQIIDGVRFELLINTTSDKFEELTCRIVIKETPSIIINQWGEKKRELIYTNCTTTVLNDNNNNSSNQELINNKYKKNTLFNKENTELTYDYLSLLESQILEPKKHLNHNNNNNQGSVECTTNKVVDKPTVNSVVEISVTSILPNTENTNETLSTKYPEYSNENKSDVKFTLNEDDQYFLDNFFSFYNFGHNNNDDDHQQIITSQTQFGKESEGSRIEKNSYEKTNLQNQVYTVNNGRSKRSSSKKYQQDKKEQLFEKFQIKYNKNYVNTLERQMRYNIFKSNLIKINQLNKNEQGTAKYGITEFSDMTLTEYKMRTGLRLDFHENKINNPIAEIPNIKLPESFDWRKKGVISEVKNQGNCGSCWAFSVIGNIEGLNAIKTGDLQEFSEQELLDCDTTDSACGGGLMDNAYKALESLGGLEYETEYPYKAHKEQCHFNKSLSHINIKGGIDLPKNETAMALWLVANGPISIGLNANAMMFYRGGISHPWRLFCRASGLDHGVLIVGFGTAVYPHKTLPYWIVKNSWGSKWGEQGYYRVYRGDNTCGINSMASSAVL